MARTECAWSCPCCTEPSEGDLERYRLDPDSAGPGPVPGEDPDEPF